MQVLILLLEWSRIAAGVLVLTLILYHGYRIIEDTKAVPLIRGVFLFGGLYLAARLFKIEFLQWLLEHSWPGLLVSLAIIFQPELRRIFTQLGQPSFVSHRSNRDPQLAAVMQSCEELLRNNRGALIAFPRKTGLKDIIDTGTSLHAELSHELLISIFAYDTPLHDGCVVIQHNRIVAAGCFLPLSQQSNFPFPIGTRHRAALGLAENTDAVVLVLSEEGHSLSLAYGADLHFNLTLSECRKELARLLNPAEGHKGRNQK